ncbi:MAG: FtsW/RodA/SpoVE family cell cycle protein [Heyndrickxia sp.]
MTETKNSYLKDVISQIKSKDAKKYVEEELTYHLEEAKKDWMEKGKSEKESEEKAIFQMGNPIKLGQRLNKLHRPKVDWLMVFLLVITLGIGFLPLLSLDNQVLSRSYLMNKVIFVLFGCVFTFGVMMVDYRIWKKRGWLFFTVGSMILLALGLLPTTYINGSPIIRIPFISINSLAAIPFFYMAWAAFFDSKKFKVWHFCFLFLFSFFLFLGIPSLSTTYIYLMMVFVMLWWSKFSRKNVWIIMLSMLSAFLLIGIFILKTAKMYQVERLLAVLNPEKYSNGAGYMILRVKEVMSKAGWFGNPLHKEMMIPNAQTDLVFASLTYYYGWIFAIVLILILSLFVARIIMVTFKIQDTYGKLLLIGALAIFGVQFFTNILMIVGLFPMTGMSLPFISYGLMPVLLNAFLIGMVLSIYRRKDLVACRY